MNIEEKIEAIIESCHRVRREEEKPAMVYAIVANILEEDLYGKIDFSLLTREQKSKLLLLAADHGQNHLATKLLKDPDIDINAKDRLGASPLNYAIVRENMDLLKELLLRKDLDVTWQEKTTILSSPTYFKENEDIIFNLLSFRNDLDLSVENNDGYNVFHLAAACENPKIIRLFMEYSGATISEPTPQQYSTIGINSLNGYSQDTPLHIAVEKGYINTIKELLSYPRVNINAKDADHFTPLHSAVKYRGDMEIIQLFLHDPRTDPNITNNKGETPLHLAAKARRNDIYNLLLGDGRVDPNIRNIKGHTAADILQKYPLKAHNSYSSMIENERQFPRRSSQELP